MTTKRTALVTGASRGIGRATVIEFAKKGYDVLINFKTSKEKASELANYIEEKYHVKCLIFQADISKEEDCLKLYQFALDNFQKIDVLINNAGICFDIEMKDRTVGHFINTFKTNVFGAFFLSKLFADLMFENKYGKIINISSNNSINQFYPTSIDYDASKSALNSMTKNFAIEYAPYLNVNAVAPGWIDTDMNSLLTEEFMQEESKKILKRRIGKPEDVAKLVAFLASDDADYIDGEVIVIDGGMF